MPSHTEEGDPTFETPGGEKKKQAEQLPQQPHSVIWNQKENMWGQDEGCSCDVPSVIDSEQFVQ